MADKQYVVTGMMVIAKTMTNDGLRVLHLGQGSPVPPDVDQAWIDHHLAQQLITEVPSAPAPPAAVTQVEPKVEPVRTTTAKAKPAG